jgi:hypothetical protein
LPVVARPSGWWRDGALEDVGVFGGVGASGIRVRESEDIAVLGEK